MPGRLESVKFQTETCCDFFTVDGQQFSGISAASQISQLHVDENSVITFKSDSSVNAPGFEICLEMPITTEMPTPMDVPAPESPAPTVGVVEGCAAEDKKKKCKKTTGCMWKKGECKDLVCQKQKAKKCKKGKFAGCVWDEELEECVDLV